MIPPTSCLVLRANCYAVVCDKISDHLWCSDHFLQHVHKATGNFMLINIKKILLISRKFYSISNDVDDVDLSMRAE